MSVEGLNPAIRLAEFSVQKLFNEFDYSIPLNPDQRITAVIAPNGSGKTVCLRLINALFRRQWSLFKSTDFTVLKFKFSDGRSVQVSKAPSPETEDESPSVSLGIRFSISSSNDLFPAEARREWSPRISDLHRGRLPSVERYIPFLTRIGPTRWTHDVTGQQYNAQEVLEAYADQLPGAFLSGVYADEPDDLKVIIESIDCHLIETQRLLILAGDESARYRGSDRRPASTLAIAQKAQLLKTIIAQSLTEYATLSQSLDRSFPRRVIAQSDIVSQETLKQQLQALDEQRRQLMDAGLLGTEASDPVSLPVGGIEGAISRVLGVYAEDTKKKLESLSPLLEKVKLLKELIDQRFRYKSIEVDRDAGFKVRFRENDVPLDKLSSGEQHQLVLFFELLFELKSNALILIDEPELSLHVAWQRKFISDLNRIIGLNKFDVVLATHSPQLIAHWEELVVELGAVDY